MTKKIFIIFINVGIFFTMFLSSLAFSQETLTITTYYPAPFGVYRELQLLKQDHNQEIRLNSDNTGSANIELRSLTPVASGTPYIDFSNDSVSDFDYRLILMGDGDFRFQGGTATFTDNAGTSYANVRAAEFWICSGAVTAP